MQVMKARERVNKWFIPESPEQSPNEQADVAAWHQTSSISKIFFAWCKAFAN